MATVEVHHAKTHLSALLAKVESGEEIVIARGDRPVAKLVPVQAPRRELGSGGYVTPPSFFEDLPEDELQAWSA